MNKNKEATGNDLGSLAEDARALLAATADVAGQKAHDARERLAAAMEQGREILGRVKDKAIDGAKATDQVVRKHPYQAIGIAVGVGLALGYLVSRRCSRDD